MRTDRHRSVRLCHAIQISSLRRARERRWLWGAFLVVLCVGAFLLGGAVP